MKKLILIGLVLLLSISIATALEDTCYQYDTNGDCVIGGDDNTQQIDEAMMGMRDHFDLTLYDDNWNNLGEIECPLSIWDVNGDGVLGGDDYPTIYGILDAGSRGDIIPIEAEAGVPKKLTLSYDGTNLVAKLTTYNPDFYEEYREVPRGCINVDIDGTKYLTDINGEVIIPMTLTCGTTYTATMQGYEQKRIPDLSASYYSGDCSAPVIEIYSLLDGITISGLFNLAWKVTDVDNDLLNIDYSAWDSNGNIILDVKESYNFEVNLTELNSSELPDGDYSFKIVARDNKELTSEKTINFKVDNIPDSPVSIGTSGGGGGGNHEYITTAPIIPAPVIPKAITPASVAPTPIVEETPAANPTPVTPTPTTGAAIINGITSNPGIAAGIAILVIGLIAGVVFYFRKK